MFQLSSIQRSAPDCSQSITIPRYGTVGTPRKLWSVWKEREDTADFISELVNRPLDTVEGKRVALDFAPYMKRHAWPDGRPVAS